MEGKYIDIEINLNKGKEDLEFWTSDLTYDYVKINAEYHTWRGRGFMKEYIKKAYVLVEAMPYFKTFQWQDLCH